MRLFIIIFSAGYSKRFRDSFKKDIPKPLIPIYNKKLIDIHLKNLLNLKNINIKSLKIYINLHYKAFEIFDYVEKNYYEYLKKRIINFLFEPNLLGHIKTIDKLRSYVLNSDLFFIINCDSVLVNFNNYFNVSLDFLFNYQVDNIVFIADKKVTNDRKTYTHFETQDYFSIKLRNKLIKIQKVKEISKMNLLSKDYVSLYVGYSIFKINRNFNNVLLSNNFKELSFIDFLRKLDLYSIKVSNFFEITQVKDYLNFLNFYLFYHKYLL